MTFGALSVLGFVGAATNIVMFIPQGVSTWRHRGHDVELRAMSWTSQALIVFNTSIWLIYAICTRDLWLGIPTLVNLPIAMFSMIVVFRAHRRDRDET